MYVPLIVNAYIDMTMFIRIYVYISIGRVDGTGSPFPRWPLEPGGTPGPLMEYMTQH
jgi:hypothetical protein